MGGSHHRFIDALGRTRTLYLTCQECENHIAPHEGPSALAEFEYLVRDVADALVQLGRGSSYTDTAKRVRLVANVGKTNTPRDVVNGQTVAEWVADFTTVVAARHQETVWPECLVRDSTEFQWTNPRTGTSEQMGQALGQAHAPPDRTPGIPPAGLRQWCRGSTHQTRSSGAGAKTLDIPQP
ncbi:MAG: hypothetical protein HQ453_02415 [Actinobacteria bacterium]|nr:hypothetical protein [Actinomycetota bacterium]